MSKIQVNEFTLPNGLHIIGESNPESKSFAMGFFVKTGARDELAKESGLSHFLEHMLFKGTAKRSAMDITFDMGNIGAQANAYTSEENTVYYAAVIPEYIAEIQDILSDMMRPALDLEEFTMEKKVILEEIALYLDRPHFYLFDKSSQDYFRDHPAGNSVLGTTDSVSAISRDDMQAYFDRRYAPGNMVLVASGNFEWQDFLSRAKEHCGSWKSFDAGRETPEFNYTPIKKVYKKENIQQSHLILALPGALAQDDRRFAMALLAVMLGDSTGSRLYWELVESGIAESASADNDEKDGVGVFSIYATCSPEKIDEVRDIVLKVAKSILDFSTDELERAKTKVVTRLVMSGESSMGRLMSLGTNWNARKEIHSLKAVIEKIRQVTADDIKLALEQYPLRDWSEFVLVPA